MNPAIYDNQPGITSTGVVGALTLTKSGTTARTATFPDATGTVALKELAQTFSALQTFSNGLTVSAGTTALLSTTCTTLTATVADGAIATRSYGASGQLAIYPYINATYGATLNSLNVDGSLFQPMAFQATSIDFLQATALRAPQATSFVIGTDPGGSDLLRVGGGIQASGQIKNSYLCLNGNSLEEYTINGVTEVAISYGGYDGGTTQFRNFTVYDGRGGPAFQIIGSTKVANFAAGVTCTTLTASSSIGLSGNSPAAYLSLGVSNTAANGYAQINLISGTLAGSLNVATGLFYKFYHNGAVPWQWESASGVVATLTAAGALSVTAGVTCTTLTASDGTMTAPSSTQVIAAEGKIRCGNTSATSIQTEGGVTCGSRTAMSPTNFGYSTAYKVIKIGNVDSSNTTSNTIAIGVDPLAITGDGFAGDGTEVLLPRGVSLRTPNSGATNWEDAAIRVGSILVGINQVVGARGAAVADATDAASVIARLNDLLSRLRTHGLIAT